jgi:hypothetical protein
MPEIDPQIIEVPVDPPAGDAGQDPKKECVMDAQDYAILKQESHGNFLANNRDGRNMGSIAMGVLQGAAARAFDELGVPESRATSGLIATPVAGPTTQAN